jgi:CheY-like chemotaxis protein
LTYADGQVTFALSPRIRGISLARKILLADDSVTAQNMGRKILADAGYEVIAVNNGSAALKKIAELKPDLVILDVYMPGYSGLEVCQRLKESQETARIPVLLTVGKLEPFKPEEAQRVRAEGFIVKPFEASELLSTLSKLEDKVVPRSEPSKPGRFARAIAAAEEGGRGGRSETAGDDNGWKSRIGFPKKKEPEEQVAEEAPAQNAANPDLRAETPAQQKETEETRPSAVEAVEPSVDMAALAPAGLPKDVTPEEVAAIAAAAAQIQMAGAIKDEPQGSEGSFSESQPSETRASEIAGRASLETVSEKIEALPVSPVKMETRAEAQADNKKEENKIESEVAEPAAAQTHRRRKGDVSSEEPQDVLVTMAATAESVAASVGGSRWTAVSVALEAEESAISLDQEMRKSYAAFAAEEKESSTATVPEIVGAAAGNSSAQAEAAVEPPVAAISNPKPEPAPEPEQATSAVASKSEPVPPDTTATSLVAAVAAPVAEVAPVAAPAETSRTPELTQRDPEPAPVPESVTPVVATEVSDHGSPARGADGLPPAEVEPPVAESAAAASNAYAPLVRDAENATEPKEDSETVKSTAAAWASWRQGRDTSKGSEPEATQPVELDRSEPAPAETAARAVAAGAEQISQEASAPAASGDTSNVANIVDSVLADLRPKLMEEISRKMSEKK